MHDNTKQFKRIKEKIKFNINIESGMRVVLGTFFFFQSGEEYFTDFTTITKISVRKKYGKIFSYS